MVPDVDPLTVDCAALGFTLSVKATVLRFGPVVVVKYRVSELNSMAPASGVPSKVPEVSFMGAVPAVAVPAASSTLARLGPVPKTTTPDPVSSATNVAS